jgi:hypothetical protein
MGHVYGQRHPPERPMVSRSSYAPDTRRIFGIELCLHPSRVGQLAAMRASAHPDGSLLPE